MEKINTSDNSETSVDLDVKVRGQQIEVSEKIPSSPTVPELGTAAPQFDQARTKTLLRKLDWHLVPFLALLYL
jgi:hypothetical protein